MKKSFLIFFGILIALSLGAIRFSDNELLLGDKTDTDKTITFDKGSGAANPKIKYESSTGELQFTNNGTDFAAIGSGGAGEISVIGNPDNATNWTASGAGITVATTTTDTDLPLGGIVSTAIKITPVSGTDYAQYCWTQPEALKNRKLKVQHEQRPLSGYVSGDLSLDVYKYDSASCGGSATRMALSTDSSSVTAIPNANGRFTTTFDADDAGFYGLRYTRVAGTTALNVTSVIVGPGIQPQGAAIGAHLAYTPSNTQGFGTITSNGLLYSRRGDGVRVFGRFITGTVAASEARLSLPSDLTILTGSGAANVVVGKWWQQNSAGTTRKTGTILALGGDSYVGFSSDDYTTASGPATRLNGSVITANTTSFYVDFTVPIAEWAGSGTVNIAQNDVEYLSDDGSSDVFGPNGALLPSIAFAVGMTNRDITVPNGSSIEEFDIEISEATGRPFQKFSSYPFACGNNANSNNCYGVRGRWNSDTVYRLQFGNRGDRINISNSDNGSTAWADYNTAGGRFRLVRSKSGQAVGFSVADSVSRGLVYGKQALAGLVAAAIPDGTAFVDLADPSGPDDLTITPGTYLVTCGGRATVTHSVVPTSTNAQIRVRDLSDTTSACVTVVPVSNGTSTLNRGDSSVTTKITVSTTTVFELQAIIDTTGGTVSDRSVDNAFMVWERLN